MTDNHPITPTLKLFREWTEYRGTECEDQFWWRIATQAARWGADQELEACCSQLAYWGVHGYNKLYEVRRPKPPNLKEQALEEVGAFEGMGTCNIDIIRRALESLPE